MASLSLDSQAAENLRYIRRTMQRASTFTAVPGAGGVLVGISAMVAGILAAQQSSFARWFAVWIGEAVLASLIASAAVLRKARRTGENLKSRPAQAFALGFAPPFLLGLVLTVALWRAAGFQLIPGTWLALYGVAVVGAGAFSVAAVPAMGLSFLVLGCIALVVPELGNIALTCGFGLLHILFGLVIARRYGG